MDAPPNPQPNQDYRLSSKSSNKVLEILLHTLQANFNRPLDSLFRDSDNLNQDQRIHLSQLKDSVDRMQLIMERSLLSQYSNPQPLVPTSDKEVAYSLQVEKVLQSLATSTSAQDSDDFYQYCVKTLAELYHCRFAFIGLLKDNKKEVLTLSVWAGDQFGENFEYELEGTPCKDIITFNKELIPTNAAEQYPDDELLVQMGIDSYYGAPLISKETGVIGIVSVMDTRPMQPNEWTAPILGVFASRIALEAQRNKAVNELVQLNSELENRVQERTQELKISNEELKAFSYSVSHDLRAPVRAINSFMDIVYEDFYDQLPPGSLEYLDRVKNAGIRLNDLIESMLYLSRVSRQELVLRKVNLSAIATELVNQYREQEPQRQVNIDIMVGMAAWCDEKLVRMALDNLIGNAWKYTKKKSQPSIRIGCNIENNKTIYFIEDNGDGFNMEYSDKLFEPFQRLHKTGEFEGHGVGLATSKRIVTRHGGEIWATSEKGKGSTFYFTLGSAIPIKNKI